MFVEITAEKIFFKSRLLFLCKKKVGKLNLSKVKD